MEIDEEIIRGEIKGMIKTLEILWEELEKSNLPKEVKEKLIMNFKTEEI